MFWKTRLNDEYICRDECKDVRKGKLPRVIVHDVYQQVQLRMVREGCVAMSPTPSKKKSTVTSGPPAIVSRPISALLFCPYSYPFFIFFGGWTKSTTRVSLSYWTCFVFYYFIKLSNGNLMAILIFFVWKTTRKLSRSNIIQRSIYGSNAINHGVTYVSSSPIVLPFSCFTIKVENL